MKSFLAAAAFWAGLLASPWVAAQQFPAKPMKMLVGFAPGGAPDLLARLIGPPMAEGLGQPMLVENRAGATGNIAAQAVAKGDPDGHTLLMATVSVAILPAMQKLAYAPELDFEPVGMVASVPLILVANPSVRATTVQDLLALARAQPGRLNFASVGNGSPQHLSGELFQMLGGVKMTHVPYKGGGPATQAVLAGETEIFFAGMPPALPQVRAGKLRALAVTSARRSPAAPEVPTVAEAGLKDFEADNWHALYAPKGTPAAIVSRLNGELNRVLALPEIREAMLKQGAEPWVSSAAQARDYLKREMAKWGNVVQVSGAKAD